MKNQLTTEIKPDKDATEIWGNWLEREAPYFAFGVLAILSIAYVIFKFATNGDGTPEQWGQFGDFIGGLMNPIISGLALLALVVSIRLQRTELAETRSELEYSRLAMEEQAQTARQQRNEQRFFDLFNIYQATLNGFVDKNYQGKEWLYMALQNYNKIKEFRRQGDNAISRSRIHGAGGIIEFPTESTEGFLMKDFQILSPHLSHYFRVIYTITKELENLLKEDHWNYAKILRAQLSNTEVELIALNVLLSEEGRNMIPLIEKYGLLKHMDKNKLRDLAEEKLDQKSFGRKFASRRQTT